MKIKILMNYILIFFILFGVFGHSGDLFNSNISSLDFSDDCYIEEMHYHYEMHEMMDDGPYHIGFSSFYYNFGLWFLLFLIMIIIISIILLKKR
jgi:ABC-type uncharacterized transport system permease subunit